MKKSPFDCLTSVIQLLRPKHWLKNLLVLVSIVFAGWLFDPSLLGKALVGVLAFSFASSAVYIFNDIRDAEADRHHEIKCRRPIAAGKISAAAAVGIMVVCLLLAFLLNLAAAGLRPDPLLLLCAYLAVNIGYSLGLKNVPFVDILLLVSGFVIRLYYGAAVIDNYISNWVLLSVMALSFYMSLGKRRNELLKAGPEGSTRRVLRYYSFEFLDKFMYLCLTCAIVFYALWSVDSEVVARFHTDKLVWTVPIVIVLMMKYSADIESDSHGDPVDVITHDKMLFVLMIIYAIVMLLLIYLPQMQRP